LSVRLTVTGTGSRAEPVAAPVTTDAEPQAIVTSPEAPNQLTPIGCTAFAAVGAATGS